MVNRTELVRILSVCVCLYHVVPASPCGGNPMRSLENFARNNGFDSSAQMLHFMRVKTRSDYSSFMSEYRRYLDCMQMVQNGYFKRSTDHAIRIPVDIQNTLNQYKKDGTQLTKRHVNRVEQNIVADKVDAGTTLSKKQFIKFLIKRIKETSEQRMERNTLGVKEEMKKQLKQILAGKLSSLLNSVMDINKDGSKSQTTHPAGAKTNVYTDIYNRQR